MKTGSSPARLQRQLMAFPLGPGACHPTPRSKGSGKIQLGLEPRARAGCRERSLPARVRLESAAPTSSGPDSKVPGKFRSPKGFPRRKTRGRPAEGPCSLESQV